MRFPTVFLTFFAKFSMQATLTYSLGSGNKKVTRYFHQLVSPTLLVNGGWDGGREGKGVTMLPNNIDEPTTIVFTGGSGDVSISSDVSLMMYQAFSWYTNSLVAHPLVTQMATSVLLGGLGDWLCQRLESKTAFTCNYRRLCVFSLVNGLFLATVVHHWFQFLESMPILKGMPEQRAIWMVDQRTPRYPPCSPLTYMPSHYFSSCPLQRC